MNANLVERAIIANRPGEAFVLIERAPSDIEDLSMLDWQADTVPPTWEEASVWADALAVEEARTSKVAEILARLAETDKWASRGFEEAVPMSAERIAYRQALRAVLAEVQTASDPGSVQIPVYAGH